MAKKRKAAAGVATARGSSGDRQVARLEQRLARLVKDEAKRSRQLDEVRARRLSFAPRSPTSVRAGAPA